MPLRVLVVDDGGGVGSGGDGVGKRVLIAFIRFLNNNSNLLYMDDIKLYEATNSQL